MHQIFSYEEYAQLVSRFATEVPDLLSSRPETAAIALKVQRLELAASLRNRFTLAIVGQMRVGKSTLLNAIIGRDIAPTGVTETTATVNWFRNDPGGMSGKFRVHWEDGSTQDHPLVAVKEWIGLAENTSKTRHLDFFASSEFLRVANIVDTPGLRSVIQTHEKATQDFLAEKWEKTSLAQGGRADSVLYVLNPVGREADQEILRLFGENTRIPGATAYNSLAVIQKWEHLEPDPLEEAHKKCERLRKQLEGRAFDVLPVSGLLARQVDLQPKSTWEMVGKIAAGHTEVQIRDLLSAPEFFAEGISGAHGGATERKELLARCPWPIVRFSLGLAFRERERLHDAASISGRLQEVSGIGKLKDLLDRKFFRLAGIIKAATVLKKAWEPCDSAMLHLSNQVTLSESSATEAGDLAERVEAARSSASTQTKALLGDISGFIDRASSSFRTEAEATTRIRGKLDEIKESARHNFELLLGDLRGIQELEAGSDVGLSDTERRELVNLFGVRGTSPIERLGAVGRGMTDNATLFEVASDRLVYWQRKKHSVIGKTAKSLCETAENRLNGLVEHFESLGG